MWWLGVVGAFCLLRLTLSVTPLVRADQYLFNIVPYVLLLGAPVATFVLAKRWFRAGNDMPQSRFRVSLYGTWENLEPHEARKLPGFGITGIMASLLVGILMNIPLRTAEYLMAVPAIGGSPPEWLQTLFIVTTFDVVLLTSLYVVAFVAALKMAPIFPTLLVTIWALDLAMQLTVAQIVGNAESLPEPVAAALNSLLQGNLKKVLISVALWGPYLLLSNRVNITYRHRVRSHG
jgi:hypothetical protein